MTTSEPTATYPPADDSRTDRTERRLPAEHRAAAAEEAARQVERTLRRRE